MNEEKLYVIKSKSDDKFYFSGDRVIPDWSDSLVSLFRNYEVVKEIAEDNNGRLVTFVEESEKVVLTKEQAEIVENAHDKGYPATYISNETDDSNAEERLLIHAYFNGYTVEKDKKYGVWVPHVKGKMYYKDGRGSDDLDIASADCMNEKNQQFTEEEIEQYGLQDCKKEVVNDDEH